MISLDNITNAIDYAIQQMTWIEGIAVLFSIIYIYLAARENILCWGAALISVLLYIYICLKAGLYAETGLQVFYLVMAVVGYFQWKKKENKKEKPISVWPLKMHALAIVLGLIFVFLVGYFLETNTKAAVPYFDSFTTIFSMITTWMVTRKILENWLYWIVVDGSSIFLYAQRELYLTSLLFLAYTIIVIFGYFHWRRIYRTASS